MAAIDRQLAEAIESYRTSAHIRSTGLDATTEVKSPLYHYTGLEGLAGILSSRGFRFSDVFFQKDDEDLAYGLQLAADEVRRNPLYASSPTIKLVCDKVADALTKNVRRLYAFHVASFTTLHDDSSQWHDYGYDGKGVAIGLSPTLFSRTDPVPASLETMQPGAMPPMMVAPMIYDTGVSRRRMRQVVNAAVSAMQPFASQMPQIGPEHGLPFLREMSANLAVELLAEAFQAKASKFSSEKEVRLTMACRREHAVAPLVSQRLSSGRTIPYILHKLLDGGGICEVLIGPAASRDAEEQVARMLRDNGFPTDVIRRSTIQRIRGAEPDGRQGAPLLEPVSKRP